MAIAQPNEDRVHGDVPDRPEDPESRYDEAFASMADPERYEALRVLTWEQRHPCPIEDCRLSAEEHHRLSFGVLSELKALRRRVEELEHGHE